MNNESIEIRLLLEAIHLKYGYNFKDYAAAHTKRRLRSRLERSSLDTFLQMTRRVLDDEAFFNTLLMDLSINVTEMFRDPWFYKTVRKELIPRLKTYSFIKVWHAGCSAGQEVYSMSIVLEEEQMKKRVQIYATDFNEMIIERARDGIYPLDVMKTYTVNYQNAGGTGQFSDYYAADNENVIIRQFIKDKILFSSHNLVTDGPFGEMHLIFCRNVLIYFNKNLQNRVLQLFYPTAWCQAATCVWDPRKA